MNGMGDADIIASKQKATPEALAEAQAAILKHL
jgi:hypothetical protein